ncbi:MAG: hypothetical protein ACFFAE_09105 [Candidatus Hodarchaeota archaeon]
MVLHKRSGRNSIIVQPDVKFGLVADEVKEEVILAVSELGLHEVWVVRLFVEEGRVADGVVVSDEELIVELDGLMNKSAIRYF